jgi:histidinol-phosphate aminotransferase
MRLQGYADPGAGLRLHLNENTGGCSPLVLAGLARLTAGEISSYPSYERLVRACAAHFDVDPEWVLLTNGLDEGLLMTAVAHVARPRGAGAAARAEGAEAIVPLPAFAPYPNSSSAVGATVVRVPPGPGFACPVEGVLAAVTPRTRLVFLNTPNNPTGQLIAPGDLQRIAAAAPQAVVVIDEAYIEFGGTSFLPRLAAWPNVIVGRTFSKAYGLAGMRVGVLIGQPPVLDPVRAVTLPFNINAAALTAASAALSDRAFLPRYAAEVNASRTRIYDACRRLGLEYWESAGNYVLVRVGADARRVVGALASRGVHVKDLSCDPVTAGCIRITAGPVAHTDFALGALQAAIAERPTS